MPLKVLCISDTHLGHMEKDPVRSEDCYRAFGEILDIAREESVDIIVHAGDMFDGSINPKIAVKTIEMMKKCRDIPFVYIHGNHDSTMKFRQSLLPLVEASGFGFGIGKENITEYIPNGLGEVEVWYHLRPFIFERDSVKIAIYGIGYRNPEEINDVLKNERVVFDERGDSSIYKILLIHQDLEDRDRPGIPREFIRREFDTIVYGHEHSHEVTSSTKEIRPGAPFPLTIAKTEMHKRGVAILKFSGHRGRDVRVKDVPIKTSRSVFRKAVVIDGEKPEVQIEKAYAEFVKSVKKCDISPLVRLVVYYNPSQREFLPSVIELRKKYPVDSANTDTIVYKKSSVEVKKEAVVIEDDTRFREFLAKEFEKIKDKPSTIQGDQINVIRKKDVMESFDLFIDAERKCIKAPGIFSGMVKRRIAECVSN